MLASVQLLGCDRLPLAMTCLLRGPRMFGMMDFRAMRSGLRRGREERLRLLTRGERAFLWSYTILSSLLAPVGVVLLVFGGSAVRGIALVCLFLGLLAMAVPISPFLRARVRQARSSGSSPVALRPGFASRASGQAFLRAIAALLSGHAAGPGWWWTHNGRRSGQSLGRQTDYESVRHQPRTQPG